MSATMETIFSFWSEVLSDDTAKIADRIKVSENLARYLDARDDTQAVPQRIVIDYSGLPDGQRHPP